MSPACSDLREWESQTPSSVSPIHEWKLLDWGPQGSSWAVMSHAPSLPLCPQSSRQWLNITWGNRSKETSLREQLRAQGPRSPAHLGSQTQEQSHGWAPLGQHKVRAGQRGPQASCSPAQRRHTLPTGGRERAGAWEGSHSSRNQSQGHGYLSAPRTYLNSRLFLLYD